eukprot:768297-Hanusia_phi.AAC.1
MFPCICKPTTCQLDRNTQYQNYHGLDKGLQGSCMGKPALEHMLSSERSSSCYLPCSNSCACHARRDECQHGSPCHAAP